MELPRFKNDIKGFIGESEHKQMKKAYKLELEEKNLSIKN